jgi:cell division protease FtsH
MILEKDKLKKVIVYNKTDAEIFLKLQLWKIWTQKSSKDVLTVQQRTHYTFDIGNDQIFQNKLEKAVAEGKLKI